ncbi:MAG: hypothetical protein KC635_30425 [Myxococcales bacterium]|nr:hypothetical protein [Myxococcales bacterium]
MAKPTVQLVTALRATVARLASGATYRWTHQGACNCGHLAQTLTALSPAEIHAMALERAGDWAQHAVDHCPESGYPIDHVIDTMLGAGLTRDDLVHLERLSDPRVLGALPSGDRDLDFRRREDVLRYLAAWADLLAAELPAAAPAADRAAA